MSRISNALSAGVSATTLLLLLVFVLLLPSSAHAQCAQWNVTGGFSILQGTNTVVNFDLTQKGGVILGTADYTLPGRETKFLGTVPIKGGDNIRHSGDVDGTVSGNSYSVLIYWDTKNIGIYSGSISPGGRMEGTAFDKANPSVKVPWYSRSNMNCPAPPPPPPPVTKTIKQTGRPRVDPPPPPAKTIKTTGRPRIPDETSTPGARITASANNLHLEAPRTEGKTTLTWDAGAAHPYAEVWVKIDGRDESKVIEKGKGTMIVPIVAGKTYLYTLTDDGKTLATVMVRFYK